MFQSFWTLDTHLRIPCSTKTYYLFRSVIQTCKFCNCNTSGITNMVLKVPSIFLTKTRRILIKCVYNKRWQSRILNLSYWYINIWCLVRFFVKKMKMVKIIHFLFSSKNSAFSGFCFLQNLDKKPKSLIQVNILSQVTWSF